MEGSVGWYNIVRYLEIINYVYDCNIICVWECKGMLMILLFVGIYLVLK